MSTENRPSDFPHFDRYLDESSVDPLEEARILLGSTDHEAYSILGHAILRETTRNRKALLSELGDIYKGIDWRNAQEVMTNSGLQTIHSHTFYDDYTANIREFRLHMHENLPVLLISDSYEGRLSGIEFHGAIDSTNLTEEQRNASWQLGLSRTPMSEIPTGEWGSGDPLYHQLRGTWLEGLKINLDLIKQHELPFIDWPVCEDGARISLLDSSERRHLPPDMKLKIQRERLEALPQKVKDFMQIDKRPEGYTFL